MSHANRGRDWERTLDSWHERYSLEGRAAIRRTPAPVKVLSRIDQGVFKGCFLGLGPPDYVGLVAGFGASRSATARAVAFDAKDCAGDRWPLKSLEAHQAEDLEEWHRLGGQAFIALRLLGRGWVLPWSELGPRWRAWAEREERAAPGSASLGVEDLEAWAVPMARLGDWLPVLP